MLDDIRKTVADSVRLFATSGVGGSIPPVRLAKKVATVLADRIHAAEASHDFARTDAADDDARRAGAGAVAATKSSGTDEGVGMAAQARADAAVKKPGAAALLDMEAGQLRSEIDAGGEYLIVDVREPAETMHGVVPGALLIPVNQVLGRIGELRDQPKPIVVYCAMGGRSRQVAQALRDRGVARTFNLKGGIGAWHSAGGDIVTQAGTAPSNT